MKFEDFNLEMPPDKTPFGIYGNAEAQKHLFNAIQKYLGDRGVTEGYVLGRLNPSDGHSLLCSNGYWLIIHSERGVFQVRAAFFSFIDAADFFIFKMLDPDRYVELDLTNI